MTSRPWELPLPCPIAHGYQQLEWHFQGVIALGCRFAQVYSSLRRHSDRDRMHHLCRFGSGALNGLSRAGSPIRGGVLRPSRVVLAGEYHRTWIDRRSGEPNQCRTFDGHVTATMVAFRTMTSDQPRVFQDVEMMGKQIPGHRRCGSQLLNRAIAFHEEVHDPQPGNVPECGMDLCPLKNLHYSKITDSILVEQMYGEVKPPTDVTRLIAQASGGLGGCDRSRGLGRRVRRYRSRARGSDSPKGCFMPESSNRSEYAGP